MGTLLYILLDGVGDHPNTALNYLSPLDAALTPYLDKFARLGKTGLVQTVGKGISPESDIAVFSMLGYDFTANYFGRGVVEAIGTEMDFRNGDLALRANFATLDENKVVIDRRAGRNLSKEEAINLSESLKTIDLSYNAEFEFTPTVAHRAVLKIRLDGSNLSSEIDNTDPAYSRIGGMGIAKQIQSHLTVQKSSPLDKSDESKIAAELVNEFTKKSAAILKEHYINKERVKDGKKPANIILLRDAGNCLPKIKTIPEKFNLKFASIVDMPVEKGVTKITGIDDYKAGNINDYETKAKKTIELIEKYDGVYIHIKGPDEPGHDGDAIRKRNIINQIDNEFIKVLKDFDDLTIIVSADHATPCTIRGHSSDPVPALIFGPNVKKDSTCRFTEREALKGDIGLINGIELLPKAITYL